MRAQRSIGRRTRAGICGLALLCGACSAPPGGSYQAACLSQGYKPATAEFDDCLRQQDLARYGDRRPTQRGVSATASW
jgi:hypothetical protein